ncbi:PREDICTED: cyclin-T1-5-like isoform X2 [Tarenaya hassleriana]|nr:PREDICTED: cyclin-T1-5-like isoform X2 [Tarenaya hassleriana]
MFLAGKVEETPRPLKDVIVVSYEIIHKKDPAAAQRIKQKEVYEQQKELILSGEKIVLSTLGFDLNVHHPYKPLVEAIKKFKVAQNALAQVAWNFVNDGLRTSLCLQFKPHHIAAGAIFLAAKFLKVKLPSDGEKVWWQEFDVTPRQLEDVSNQMLELYEQNRVPSSQGTEVESSSGGGAAHRSISRNAASMDEHGSSRQMSSRPPVDHSNSDNHGGSSKPTQNQNNDNGSGETGSVITEHKGERDRDNKDSQHLEDHAAHKDNVGGVHHKTRPGVERTGKEDSERTAGDHKDDSTLHRSRNVDTGDAPVSQSPKDLKLLRDKVKAKLEKAKKFQGERTRKKDLMDEDDLIERELEDVELAVEDGKTKQKKEQSLPKAENSDYMGTEFCETVDGNHSGGKGDIGNMEEGEMVGDASPMMNSRKRKLASPPEKQSEGKNRHEHGSNYSHENIEESSHKVQRRRHSQENHS